MISAIWPRGLDQERFNPERRDMAWRRSLGIADDELVIAFLGRLVMEKGLDAFAEAIHALATLGLEHHVLVIGDGPARAWFEAQVPDAIFAGRRRRRPRPRGRVDGHNLQPVVTETFGNVTLEAMACAPAGGRRRGDRGAQRIRAIRRSMEPSSTAPSRTSSPAPLRRLRARP